MDEIVLTHELIEYGANVHGWKKAQLQALGVDWPPVKGWKSKLIGKKVSREALKAFMNGRNKKTRPNLQLSML